MNNSHKQDQTVSNVDMLRSPTVLRFGDFIQQHKIEDQIEFTIFDYKNQRMAFRSSFINSPKITLQTANKNANQLNYKHTTCNYT
jgi:hypothetical protein